MKFTSLLLLAFFESAVLAADKKYHFRQLQEGPSTSTYDDGTATGFVLGDDDKKIVGGSQVDPGEYPYFVDLSRCGGSLIAPNVVLTAAHCGNFRGDQVIVGAFRAGSTNQGAVRATVSAYEAHPNYNDWTVENDFALLRLDQKVTSVPNPNNVVFSINDQYSNPANRDDLTVMGLGAKSEGGSSPKKLRDVVVRAIDTNTCNNEFDYNGDVIDDTMFCAGVTGGGKDSCQGDSGGPIVRRVGDQHVQVGVVSWGEGCARENFPGVYARVSSAYGWIQQVVCDQWGISDASFCDGGGGGGGGGGSCADGEMEMEFTIRTDDWGDETSWEVVSQSGNSVASGSGYGDDQSYTKKKCIPSDCYTLTIYDSYGDGLSVGGSNPGYVLKVDGGVVEEKGGINFGSSKSIGFGSCSGGGGGGGGGGGDDDGFDACYDRPLAFKNYDHRDCDWVAGKPNRRCNKTWQGKYLWEYCPLSCAVSCVDCCFVSLVECEEGSGQNCMSTFEDCEASCIAG